VEGNLNNTVTEISVLKLFEYRQDTENLR
jgi:hypothetical protein